MKVIQKKFTNKKLNVFSDIINSDTPAFFFINKVVYRNINKFHLVFQKFYTLILYVYILCNLYNSIFSKMKI